MKGAKSILFLACILLVISFTFCLKTYEDDIEVLDYYHDSILKPSTLKRKIHSYHHIKRFTRRYHHRKHNKKCKFFCAKVFGHSYHHYYFISKRIKQCKKSAKHKKGLCFNCGPAASKPHPDLCQYGTKKAHCCEKNSPTCCYNKKCTNTQTDTQNCGACGRQCAALDTCCTGICAHTLNDTNNCGSCGTICSGATSTCCSGNCTNLATDNNNCGACANACAADRICGATFNVAHKCCLPQDRFGCTVNNFIDVCCLVPGGSIVGCQLNGQPVGTCFSF